MLDYEIFHIILENILVIGCGMIKKGNLVRLNGRRARVMDDPRSSENGLVGDEPQNRKTHLWTLCLSAERA